MVGEEGFDRTGAPAPDPLVRYVYKERDALPSCAIHDLSDMKKPQLLAEALNMVGEEGFEPPTLWSQTRCATKLRYSPKCLTEKLSPSTNGYITDSHLRRKCFS